MLKTFRLTNKLSRARNEFKNIMVYKRLFLSEAYRCEEVWNRRLESPLLRKINSSTMFIELEQKYSIVGKISAVDVDIFVNGITDDSFVDEVLRIVHMLRLCTETTNTLDSTHHAVIRYLLHCNRIQDLHDTLNDRLNYGIFPDYFSFNILMDNFIKKKDYGSAVKVATLTMLQENAGHPITNALCIYSCHKYLENPDDWKKPEVQEDTSEEVKIRIPYLKNPFFDDHFDLTDPRDLVGKTLSFQGKHRTDALGRTCQLRGLLLYKKYNDVSKLIKNWLETMQNKIIYEDVFDLISEDNKIQNEVSEEFKLVETQLSILKERQNHKESLIEAIENIVKSAVSEETEKDIAKQCQNYIDWEHTRNSILEQQMKDMDIQRRIVNIETIKKDLKEREQLLTFFDNEEQIELEIEKLQLQEKAEDERIRKMHKSAKKLRALEIAEAYIPPEVKSAK